MKQKGSPRFAVEAGQTGILILVGILIIVAVAGGAYYLGTRKSSTPTSSPAPVATSQTAQPSSTPDETANWNTYTREGYKFNYPVSWTLIPYTEGCGPVFTPAKIKESDLYSDPNLPIMNVCGPSLNGETPEEDLSRMLKYGNYTLVKIEKIDFQGHEALKLLLKAGNNPPYEKFIIANVRSFDKLGTLDIYIRNGEQYRSIFDQIFSTFKFLD